jgi:DNA replication protein DnaC
VTCTDTLALDTACTTTMQAQLNPGQLSCFQTVITAITDDPQTAHFYLQGPSGTSKTFLYKTLCYYFQSQGKTVLCVVSTGIVALLLPDRQTSHSQFKISLDRNETSVSSITKSSNMATLLYKVDLII